LVRIVAASGHRYSRAQIIKAFPPVERAQKAHTERAWTPRGDDEQRIRSALFSVNPDDRRVWLECGMAREGHPKPLSEMDLALVVLIFGLSRPLIP
jgi:hypothetical protein